MSRWFRHYAGMMRDEKLVSVAVRAKQPVERVVWVWGAILESAAEINDAGRFEFDAGEAAYFLRCGDDELVRVVECLEDLGRISGGVVARWSDRQFDSDSSKERQRRYRERVKARDNVQKLHDDVGEASPDVTGDGRVTSRDAMVTPQDTETDTDNYAARARANDISARMPELYAALGVTDETKSPGLLSISEPINWTVAGCDIDADILPTLRSMAARGKVPRSWSYCTNAVFEARDRRLAPAPAVQPQHRQAAPPSKPRTVAELAIHRLRTGDFRNDDSSNSDRFLGAGDGPGQDQSARILELAAIAAHGRR